MTDALSWYMDIPPSHVLTAVDRLIDLLAESDDPRMYASCLEAFADETAYTDPHAGITGDLDQGRALSALANAIRNRSNGEK